MLEIASANINFAESKTTSSLYRIDNRCQLLQMIDKKLNCLPRLSPMAVRLLIARQTLDIFDMVESRSLSAKQIADGLGKETKKTWYLLRQLVAAGLLAEDGFQKRKGRPQKLYRTSAQNYFVPADIRAATVGRKLGEAMLDRLEVSDNAIGEHFYFDGAKWRVEKVYDEPHVKRNTGDEIWMVTELSLAEADQLAAEVRDIFDKYQKKTVRSERRSLVHFAFAPYP